MLGTAKPLASLSAALLARKGEARPAMRRPATASTPALDDLGWNDMGDDPIAPLPPVLAERRLLADAIAPAPGGARKAAFTLRLDAERHLKLRLAAAVGGRSAQALVTEALDAFLATLPDVAALHGQLPTASPRGK